MNEFAQGLSLLLGLVLRLAIPLGLTALAASLVYRLDQRWQREADRKRSQAILSIPLETRMACWNLMDCEGGKRGTCAAFKNPDKACWENFAKEGVLAKKCLDCVYPKLIQAGMPA